MKKAFVIVNKAAGRGKAKHILAELEKKISERRLETRLHTTSYAKHAEVLALEAVRQGYELIVSVGGDGHTGEIVNGIIGSSATLAIIPCGTGNDLCRELGIPLEPFKALDLLINGAVKRVDVGKINDRYFTCIAGAGFDSLTNEKANRVTWLKGKEVYIYALLRTLVSFKPAKFRIELAGACLERTAMFVAAANTSGYGGGMKLAPNACMQDGLLDICVVKAVSKWYLLYMFPKVFSGRHASLPQVELFKSPSIKITCDRPFPVYADGEYAGEMPAAIEVVPKALKVLVPY